MTMRERMLAYVQGRPHDRVPLAHYAGLAAPDEEIWARIGRGNIGVIRWGGVADVQTPHCRMESVEFERDGARGVRDTLHTPAGCLRRQRRIQPQLGVAATIEHFVKDPEDYTVLMAYLRDMALCPNVDGLRRTLAALGDDGVLHATVWRTPYQSLWVQWVCIEDLAWHLAECPQVMAEVMDLLVRRQREVYRLAAEAARELPVPYVVVPDNLTAPVIGERYFRTYCVPMYNELAAALAETGRDVPVFVHADGDLKPLWGAIGESAVRGLDSMSPPPDNDTAVADAVSMWPQMRVGVNFPSSVHLAPPQQVYRQAMQLLEEGGHTGRLQIQISEDPPPGRWRQSLPQIAKAIEDFGEVGR
jgi:hypothetical protein